MDVKIRVGTERDIDSLEGLYNDVTDYLARTVNYPGWEKGVYPTRRDVERGINEQCLFVAEADGRIVGSMMLRHRPEEAYALATWQETLDREDVWVVYTFAVHPHYSRQGIGAKMLDFAAQYAVDSKAKALRLDVYVKNQPAIALYERCGFRYIDTVSLGLEEYGLDWFKLYEKLV